MGDGAKLATAYYELIPSMKGAQSDITNKLVPAAAGAGEAAGTSMGGMLLGGIKKFAGPIALLAAGFSVKKLIADSQQQFESLVGSVNALQRIAGGTKEEVSGMRAAMQLSGVDADKASTAVTIFAKNLGNAVGDEAKTAELTAKMGTSFLDAAGNVKPMSQILPGLADTFKKMPDGAEKAALATQLFGRSGAQMIPFLNKGSEGIAALTEKAQQMGLVIDDVSAKTFANARMSTRLYAGAVQGLMVTLGGVLLPVIDSVKNVFRNAFIPVIEAATGFIQSHRTAILAVAGTIDAFADRVGGIVTGLFALLGRGDYTAEFGKALGVTEDSPVVDILFRIRDVVHTVFGAIGNIFAGLAPTLGPLVGQLFAVWSQMSPLSLIFNALAPVIPQLVSVLVTLGQSLSGALMPVLTTLMPIIANLVATIGGALGDVFKAIVPLLPPIVALVGQLAATLAGALGSALQVLLPILAQIVAMLLGQLGSTITTLMPIVGKLIGVIGPILGQILSALAPLIATVAEAFGQILMALMPLVKPVLDLVMAFMPLLTPLLALIGPILQPLIQLLTAVLTPILALITPILNLLIPVLTWLYEAMATVIGWIVQALVWFIGLVTQSEETQKGIRTAWAGVLSFFGDMWNGIVGFFATGISGIVSFFTKLPGQILDALAGLGGMLVDVGRNMIQGLLDGAGALLSNIGTFFLTIIPDWIVAPFKAALGIHSPSTVFAALGGNIVDGLVGGIAGGRTTVHSTLRDLVTIPRIPSPTGAARAGTSGSALAGVHQVNNFAPGLDANDVVRLSTDALNTLLRRR